MDWRCMLSLYLLIISFKIISAQICRKDIRILGKTSTIYYCCRPLDVLTRKCEECDTGYEFIGSRCEPCKSGQYGLKCTDTCYCKAYESCDHIRGCIQKSTNQLITGEHITPITEKTTKDSENEGFLNKESGVYFGSFGILAFVICILMAYICYKKGERKVGSNMPTQNPNELAMDIKCHEIKGEMITNENDYDEIDERYLSNVKLAVNQEKDIKNKKKVQQGGSKLLKKEKSNSSIYPYQLVVSSAVDVHEYSLTETGGNSEDNYRDSGYLHPYQPLSLDTKNLKHDYTECKYLDIVESKATIDMKHLKHDYTECKGLDIVESKATIDNTDVTYDYTECKDLDIVESKATIDNKDFKDDYTECEDLHTSEALASNNKEDDADNEFKAEDAEDTK